MAKTDLIIDEDYIHSMQSYFTGKANEMESIIKSYLAILGRVRSEAIMSGDAATALSDYISYAQVIKDQLPDIAKNINSQLNNFINSVDNADRFLY